jgi:hypothetical protein
MNVGGTQQFSTNFPATWTTGGGLGLVSSSGFYTAPTTNGTYHVTAIAQNGGANAVATITVTGQLNFIPLLTTPIAWNTTTTQSAPVSQVFTVTNQGSGSVTPTVVLTGTGYSITANTCTGPIAGFGTCSITVQFVSATIGFYSGNLQIVDSAGGIQNTPLGVTIPNPAAFHVDPFTSTIAINQTETLVANLPAFYSTNFGTINDVGLFTAPGTAGTATVTATQQSVIVSNLNQTPATSWKNCGNCGDTGGPNGGTHGTFTIIPGDPATFSIVPSQGFDNFFWWQVLGAPGDFNASVDFVLSFEMQFRTQADKNASQAIEFELQKNVLDHQYSMAWQACFACGNKWRVFNKTTHAWEDSGVAINPTDFAGGKWVTIVTTYHLTTGTNTRHVAISVNGVNHVVNINHAPTPAVESDYLHPAFQMDSNSSATPYTVLLRNFNVGTPSATTATATVNVVTVIPNSVSPSSVTLPVSGTQQFTATSSSTWATTCGTLNTTTGTSVIFTAPNSAQSCTITATNTSGGIGTATATAVTVAVNPSSVTMQINSVQQFTANVPVTWSAGCGTIDPVSGKYTAPAAPASCSIVATAQNGGATGTANVTVQNPPPTSTGTHGRGIKHKAKVIR